MAAGPRKKDALPPWAEGRLSRGSGEGRRARRGGRGRGRRGRRARLYPEALRAIRDSQDGGSGRGEHRNRPRGQPASDAVRLDGAAVVGVGEGLLGDSQGHRGQDERRNQKEAPANQSTTHDESIPPRADALSKNVMTREPRKRRRTPYTQNHGRRASTRRLVQPASVAGRARAVALRVAGRHHPGPPSRSRLSREVARALRCLRGQPSRLAD